MLKSFTSALVLFATSSYATFRLESCPSYEPMDKFELPRYLGTWYEIAVDAQTPFELFSECTTATYTAIDESTVKVDNRAWWWLFNWGWDQEVGKATLTDPSNASSSVAFFDREVSSDDRANYTILDTDYDTYSIVYSCESMWGGWASFDYMWILARETSLDADLMANLIGKLQSTIPNYEFFEDAKLPRVGDDCKYDTFDL